MIAIMAIVLITLLIIDLIKELNDVLRTKKALDVVDSIRHTNIQVMLTLNKQQEIGMKLDKMMLKKREVIGNMYLYTYVSANGIECKIAALMPRVEEVVIEGDNNNIILPCVPDKITIKGSNNTVRIEEEVVIPYFNKERQKQRATGFIKRLGFIKQC